MYSNIADCTASKNSGEAVSVAATFVGDTVAAA
jgi:hypothetical protein